MPDIGGQDLVDAPLGSSRFCETDATHVSTDNRCRKSCKRLARLASTHSIQSVGQRVELHRWTSPLVHRYAVSCLPEMSFRAPHSGVPGFSHNRPGPYKLDDMHVTTWTITKRGPSSRENTFADRPFLGYPEVRRPHPPQARDRQQPKQALVGPGPH